MVISFFINGALSLFFAIALLFLFTSICCDTCTTYIYIQPAPSLYVCGAYSLSRALFVACTSSRTTCSSDSYTRNPAAYL